MGGHGARFGLNHDAIVVVPGIMGTALQDIDADRQVWGFTDPRWLMTAWCGEDGLAGLALTDGERDALAQGRYNPDTARVRPNGLIGTPAWAPTIKGIEPYTSLVRELKNASVHSAAVLEFGYDWRLPVDLNGRLLRRAAHEHLRRWRTHPEQTRAIRDHPAEREAQLVIVAHSMGGLVTQEAIRLGLGDVRQVVTLGTPFYGAIKTLALLESGAGSPTLPHTRLRRNMRDLARGLPGVYDLLPRLRSLLTQQNDVEDVVALTASNIADLGADSDLAAQAFARFEARHSTPLPGHLAYVGHHQPTAQSARISAGGLQTYPEFYEFYANDGLVVRDALGLPAPRRDSGDGTVPIRSARPIGHIGPRYVAQQHGALPTSKETIKAIVTGLRDEGGLGDRLGDGEVGLEVPDLATAGEYFRVSVTRESDPARLSGDIVDLTEKSKRPLRFARDRDRDDGGLVADVRAHAGLHRVTVKPGAVEPVTQLILVSET
ncbi:MAG: esterase/lipase family protein [Actinomycetales bacterium]